MFQKQILPSLAAGLTIGFLSFPAIAEPLARLEPLLSEPSDELRPDALISGNWLVGIHLSAAPAEDVPKLYSYVSSEWKEASVCVRVTGEEGRYNALYPYQMPDDWEGGLIEFIYPTRHPDFVQGIGAGNSGVAVHKGTCDEISEDFVPVLWNTREAPTPDEDGKVEIVLNINAGRADSVFGIAEMDGQEIEMVCDPTPARGVGFNYKCVFKIQGDLTSKLNVSIERLRFGRAAPPRDATIDFFPLGNQ